VTNKKKNGITEEMLFSYSSAAFSCGFFCAISALYAPWLRLWGTPFLGSFSLFLVWFTFFLKKYAESHNGRIQVKMLYFNLVVGALMATAGLLGWLTSLVW